MSGSRSTARCVYNCYEFLRCCDYSWCPQVRAVAVEDKNSAVETVSRERATSDPGSVGAPMSGVVVEVRVKEGQEIKKGDPVCGQ